LRLVAVTTGLEIKEQKVQDRTLSTLNPGPVSVAWWMEGKHAVVVVTTDKPEAALKRMTSGNHARLPSNALYKKITEVKEFDTTARAFLDTEALTTMAAGTLGKEVKQVIETLGLNGLRGVTFLSGYENEAERGLTEIHYSGERKGLLGILTGKPFKL